jgi:leucyl/phenylalanyl-tRNA--protein transferase
MKSAYIRLHEMGIAHSIEVHIDNELVGGIYGLALGSVFFGESMFSKREDTSKIALVALCRQLQKWDFALLDCQVSNPHLLSMGARDISREDFNRLLATANGPSHWKHDFCFEKRL